MLGKMALGATKVSELFVSVPWDVTNAQLTGNTFSLGSENYRNIYFKPDGTKLYTIEFRIFTDRRVVEYSLSTAWDITTASVANTFTISDDTETPQGIDFKPDGTKMYLSFVDDPARVNEYSLSTAWNVSTASYVAQKAVDSGAFPPDTFFVYPQDLFFKSDGTSFTVLSDTTGLLKYYTLSTAWDITTAAYVSEKDISANSDDTSGMYVKPDGLRIFIVNNGTDAIQEYSITTAYNPLNATYVKQKITSSPVTNPTDVSFKDDGTRMYVIQGSTLYEYQV